jgi:alkylhydroperoxidase family enzyme
VARIEPLPPGEWPPEMKAALAALRPPNPRHPFPPQDPGRPKGLNLLGTFARHPELARAYNTFNGHILFATTITPRQRELLVLRVAALRHADYEWAQHAVLAGDAGISPDEVTAIQNDPEAHEWDPLDRALLRAVDDLVREARLSDPVWTELVRHLDDRQLMDVVFTVGAYEILAMVMRSFDVELDDDLRRGP